MKVTEKGMYVLCAKDKDGYDLPIYVAYDQEDILEAEQEWKESKEEDENWERGRDGLPKTFTKSVAIVE